LSSPLERDGQRPLRFEGTLLAASDGSTISGREPLRYYRLALYRAASGPLLLHWQYVTTWRSELGHNQVQVASAEEAISALEQFDPCAWVEAFRPLIRRGGRSAATYQARQDAEEQQVRARYLAQVAQMARDLDVVEEL